MMRHTAGPTSGPVGGQPIATSGGPMSGRRITRLLAALAALTAGAALALAGAGTPALGADSKVTFTVGVTQDVDSLNPFTGIAAASYEIYQLNYDTLTDYAQKDFSTVPSLASTWDTSS